MARQQSTPFNQANLHVSMPNSQIHNPKGFDTAGKSYIVEKDFFEYLNWIPKLYQNPVEGFISLAGTVTPTDGLRYIVTGSTSLSSSSAFAGANPNSIVEYLTLDPDGVSVNEWAYIDPDIGTVCYVENLDTHYYYDGGEWKALGVGGGTIDGTYIAVLNLDGTAGNGEVGTVDLVAPSIGKVITDIDILVKDADLLPDSDVPNISVIYTNGTPVTLVEAITAVELNDMKLMTNALDPVTVTSGYSVKLNITGANLSGNMEVKIKYWK